MDSTGICNEALAHLGMSPIDAMADDNPSAKACTRYFESSKRTVLSERQWAFAFTPEELSVIDQDDVGETALGWTYLYTYPVNAATVWNVYNEATFDKKDEQEKEVFYWPAVATKVIGSDLESAYADYTHKDVPISLWDDRFIKAMTYRLAADIANTLCGPESKLGLTMGELYINAISEASRIGASERRKKPEASSGYIDAR